MRPASDLARELLAQLDARVPGLALGLDQELLDLLTATVAAAEREARATAFDEAARVVALNPVDRARYPHTVAVELDNAAHTLRGAAARERRGLPAWPAKAARE